MAAFDEKDYTKSFDWSIWKRLTPYYNIFGQESRAASPAFPPSRA